MTMNVMMRLQSKGLPLPEWAERSEGCIEGRGRMLEA